MHILIAPDAFKECLSARRVALALKEGVESIFPEAEIRIAPMADGGEGTVESVIDATGGELIKLRVKDPLMRDTPSFYGITGDGSTAVIEMAAASGIELLSESERNPWITSTYGTGQLVRDALDRGCRRILLGIGGSATNDGGTGMAKALGADFLDRSGNDIGPGGGALANLVKIHLEGMDARIAATEILVACDVTNPLTGPDGASAVYGPQKGADRQMVNRLDRNLVHLDRLIREQLGKEISLVPGAGAAGGLGGGLMAFLGASLMKGFDMIAGTVELEEKIRWADLVITGEGRMDGQTQNGKTPYGVAQLAGKHGKPVVGVAGSIENDSKSMVDMGFQVIISIQEKPSDLDYAITHAEELLVRTGERIARLLHLGFNLPSPR